MRRLAFAVAFVFVLAGACKRREAAAPAAKPPEQKTTTGAEVGATMPEYSAMWLDGSKLELAAKRDKVVLLNVWATWCGPCRYEIPELQKLHADFADKGLEVIGVSVDESGVESVKQFVDEHKMTYPVALDAEGRIANILQTSVLPTSVLVDRDGKIVWKRAGIITPEDAELAAALKKAL